MSDMADKKTLLVDAGKHFRGLRESLGWTQQRLASAARVSRDTIFRLERGDVVDASSLVALLDAMGQRLAFEPRPALRPADMRRLFPEVHEDAE